MDLRKTTIFLFHLLVIFIPLFFYAKTDELFEFNKIMLTYVFAVGIVGVWVARMIIEKRVIWKKTPFDIPLAVFLISQILSTMFSVHMRTSWFGYYSRFNGGLLSILTYISLYYAFINTFKKEEVFAFLRTVLYGGLMVCLYAIPEHFGHSPSCLFITNKFDVQCWVQDVQSRVFATFGQPNWLAAYLIMLIPLAFGFLIDGWKNWSHRLIYSALIIVFFATLLFTASRSGLLALAIGVILGGVLFFACTLFSRSAQGLMRTMWKPLTLTTIVCAVLFFVFGKPFVPSLEKFWKTITPVTNNTASQSATPVQQSGTQLESGGTESGVIRSIVWKGAMQVWKRYPIFGSGVETFAYSYYADRPMEHNLVSEWDFLYNKAHNEFLNYLATTGAFGFLSYLLLIGWVYVCAFRYMYASSSPRSTLFTVLILSGFTALHVSNFFGFSTVFVSILFYLTPAWIVMLFSEDEGYQKKRREGLSLYQWIGLISLLIFAGYLWRSVWRLWQADIAYSLGKQYTAAQAATPAFQSLQKAIDLSPNEALFHDELSSLTATLAVSASTQKQASLSAQLMQLALAESNTTLSLNAVHLNFYKTRARVLITLSQLNPKYLDEVKLVLEKAHELAPTDPKLVFNLAVIAESQGDKAKAKQLYETAIQMKPDYGSAKDRLKGLEK
ncbi:MAG: O-antigen polymerase [Microgenomates group bacterium GW2011_GWA1_46_15]|nr:MAG: O-antigen polymerase [Microgenomates group bacterium GW2011_GWB1_45_17]KKU24218.1 MAG: O-antigen polymerase [Microgenomates group bacterium GW2011_GWC1_46_15]KKU24934.1 MAG: O-antigen polymerase [Microgenomates group bacterium GW2011_GWA1_46_15]